MVVGAPGPAHLSWRVLAHTPLRWADIEPLLDKNMNPAAKEKVKMFCSPENIKGLCAKFADLALLG
ncbi:unnamed protein product [Cladocopium goreaui]|uniref:Uncharacterized protein n=1 Tax=Cladocopium goreaui TaxID=2562237 RepID=A0A9P1FXE7_9DINO|nr:unnamed protein product [Cladocopium goreaui]